MTFDIDIRKHTLANGLRVVVSPDTTTAMAAVNLLYDVGSRDERRGLTGLAHLFEHLMFGPTEHVPDFDAEVENAGGRSNAWTSNDFTNFYVTLPAQNLRTVMRLESDRMAFLKVDDRSLQVQRGVVVEEFKQQCLDRPYGDLYHRIRAAMYSPEHPYSWPTIGLVPEHVAGVRQTDAEAWYRSHYCPQRAILAVSGRVDPQEVFDLVEEWFGEFPSGTSAERHMPPAGFPSRDIYEEVVTPAPVPLISMAYPMAAYGQKGYDAADAITDLLSAGRASRFVNNLVQGSAQGLISSADASIVGSEHEGMLIMTASLTSNSDADLARARRLILDEARRLADSSDITDHEWERMLTTYESTFRFGNTGYLSRATNLALAEYHGENINATVEKRRSLSKEEVSALAEDMFGHTPSATIVYRPE